MKRNLGNADKIIRLLIGAITLILYFTGMTSGTTGLILIAVGVILALTSLINWCPIYAILGISTKSSAPKT